VDPSGYSDLRARHEATIWQRMNHVLGILLLLAVWLLIVSFFLPPYKKLTQNRHEIEQMQSQLMEEKGLLARHTREISLLKSDPTYLETIARDKLDLMKDGETIFRLEARPPESR
jgi:cell division protein FtsB